MINAQMRNYDYYTFGKKNSYGQPSLSEDKKGTVKMAIHLITEAVEDNSFNALCPVLFFAIKIK